MAEIESSELAKHASLKDLWVAVHGKVYDATSFVSEHPGGEEVLMDVGGQDATEAFEDVGHSDEAREILDGLYKADLHGSEARKATLDDVPVGGSSTSSSSSSSSGGSSSLYSILFVLVAVLAYLAYRTLQ